MAALSPVRAMLCQPDTSQTHNFMNRFVRWVEDDKVPLVAKISAVALGAIALIGVAFLSGYPTLVLGLSIVAMLPLSVWMDDESENVDRERRQIEIAETLKVELTSNLNTIKDALAKKSFNYDDLLELPSECIRREYCSRPKKGSAWQACLKSSDMRLPVMKGTDDETNFIALRVVDQESLNSDVVLIAYVSASNLFGMYPCQFGLQILNYSDSRGDFIGDYNLIAKSGPIIDQILKGTHARFKLKV